MTTPQMRQWGKAIFGICCLGGTVAISLNLYSDVMAGRFGVAFFLWGIAVLLSGAKSVVDLAGE